jgi:hypothetical protein
MATLLADSVALGGQFLLRWLAAEREIPARLWIFPNLMLYTALVTGLLSILLLPAVYRFRRTPPPPAIAIVCVIAALVPWAAGLVQAMR